MPQAHVYNASSQTISDSGQEFPPGGFRTIPLSTWTSLTPTVKAPGKLELRDLIEDPPGGSPDRMASSADFSPAHFYSTKQGGTRLFSAAANADLPNAASTPVLVIENPGSSGAVIWNWRVTLAATTNCKAWRYRVDMASLTKKQGATPVAMLNRGGGKNTSAMRFWKGADVIVPAPVATTRADPLGAWMPWESYVHGSAAVPPGAVVVYALEPVEAAKQNEPVPWGSVEYVWWELPWEG